MYWDACKVRAYMIMAGTTTVHSGYRKSIQSNLSRVYFRPEANISDISIIVVCARTDGTL